MDRTGGDGWAGRAGARRGPGDDFVLPSRGRALDALCQALDAGEGPALLTGEPGVGKTWLCRKLGDALPGDWRWVSVDLSPAVGPAELYALILHGMGLPPADGPAGARAALADAIAEATADGGRWGLIVEEGHAARFDVLEELRVLTNRMGDPGALAGLLLTAQNALGRRLSTRPLAGLGSRVAARFHLRPLTVDELRDWLGRFEPDRSLDLDQVERLHRDTGGIPRRLPAGRLRSAPLGGRIGPSRGPVDAPPAAVAEAYPTSTTAWDPPVVLPSRPPLQVGDGMIEVGWDADQPEPDEPIDPMTEVEAPGEEVVNDHYAALQAWGEWVQNQDRDPVGAEVVGTFDTEGKPASPLVPGHPGLRAEGQHAFAPYSQLFSRLRQSRDST